MRVPLSWLREYVDVDLSPEALADRLTLLGMEVKGIERLGTGWTRVVVGELLAVERHPNSTRLSLTTVKVGEGEPTLSIVCGATNIAVGQRVPVALVGSVLPGDRRIETARLAGVESQGMLCSGDELGLSSDADGILILPPETPLGIPLEDLVGDMVLDVDVKPNRGDALSIIGLAREVAAATGAALRWPDISVAESGDATSDHLSVDVQDTRPLPPVRGPLPRRRPCRAVTVRGRSAPAGGRRAAHQQRRGCQQLRDARAGQAHPHVRRGGHHGRPDHRPRRARGRAARRPSTMWSGCSTRTCCSSPTRPGRWASPASWAVSRARSPRPPPGSSSSRPSSTP